jgi:hypothetical protein
MASPHYITWQDAAEHLDERVYRDIDMVRMGKKVVAAEVELDNALRRQFNVPFDAADNPDAYELAGQIVAFWAASDYIVSDQQVQGNEQQVWYARKLRGDGDRLLKMFRLRHHPDDAEDAAKPMSFVPKDVHTMQGKSPPEPFFKRSQAQSGSSDRW